jgi:2-polyprenyl-3-methyl-5-hydroxy-6-metoxy-1,4-benzoquinol methylase
MPVPCELCGREALAFAYAPERSNRGISVYICGACGLVQSEPRADRAARAPAAASSGADWGNVRYGKGFRTQIALDALLRHIDSPSFSLLDVGSNRGSFINAVRGSRPDAAITAVEPDERVAQSVAGSAELIVARIEDAALPADRFDVVHSCHTIEHVAHPLAVLRDHHRVLKDGGLLILDAPNIALIGADDVVEEWFIDKHLTHFSERTLTRMVEAAGFTIVQRPDTGDRENLFLVARKAVRVETPVAADPPQVDQAYELISSYVAARSHNTEALTSVAAELTGLAPRGIAIWGAGRIFDSLIVYGKFDPKLLCVLIDKHLAVHVAERHGCRLNGPDALSGAKPGVIVVMSRGFAREIAVEAKAKAPGAEILLFTDLLGRARLRLAA